jgi:hypothetical protein
LGEIKSTLDIVLEKTKHLKLSQHEKHEQKSKEFEKRLMGLLQKYQDQLLNLHQLQKELNRLKKSNDLPAEKILIPAVLERIDLDKDNEPLLSLLDEIYDIDVTHLRAVLTDYQNVIHAAARKREDALKEYLMQHHSISGSAVLPNLEGDDAWVAELQHIRSESERKLSREKTQLADPYSF